MSRLVLIDNYDSFTWNLVQAFRMLDVEVEVVLNDVAEISIIETLTPDFLVISPGPGRPTDAGISNDAIRQFAGRIPILGVCLGHQCIAELYGGHVSEAGEPRHGKTSAVYHDESGLFATLPQGIATMRYHSLVVDRLPEGFIRSAWTQAGEIMGLRHAVWPIEGVQFHPESILTPDGLTMLKNFLRG